MEPEALPDERHQTSTGGEGYRVLLYNDHAHWMDEVVNQVVKALRCDLETAAGITMRAHRNGRAVVTITDKDEATRVADVLREINLRVSVDQV